MDALRSAGIKDCLQDGFPPEISLDYFHNEGWGADQFLRFKIYVTEEGELIAAEVAPLLKANTMSDTLKKVRVSGKKPAAMVAG
jgi:hypothetical protein